MKIKNIVEGALPACVPSLLWRSVAQVRFVLDLMANYKLYKEPWRSLR